MGKDDYSEAIADLHKLSSKMNVITILYEVIDSVINDPEHRGDELGPLTSPSRMNLAVELSMQVLSITLELIEDLAGFCFAFRRATKQPSKNVAEYLRDWDFGKGKEREENGDPDDFYRNVSGDIRFAAEVSGLDPIADWNQARRIKDRFAELRSFRDKYQKWYQGYKHGQRSIPVFSTPTGGTPLGPGTVWGVFLIPRPLTELESNGPKVYVDFTESFLATSREVSSYFEVAKKTFVMWL
ncbi:MAG TPA: hypothetical protein VGR56_05015, partial [Nitrososphaerales archaeon]|nr:hypothetical protein [Nitrososphaerales archaeon]